MKCILLSVITLIITVLVSAYFLFWFKGSFKELHLAMILVPFTVFSYASMYSMYQFSFRRDKEYSVFSKFIVIGGYSVFALILLILNLKFLL